MADFPALPFWTDAYLADTRHLTTLEHGAYFLLLSVAWRSPNCDLPDDDKMLARFAGLGLREWRRIKPTIMEFWDLHDGRLTQKRLLKERSYVSKRRDQRKEAAHARWLKNNNTTNANASSPHGCRNAPTPTPTPLEEEEEGRARTRGTDLEPQFENSQTEHPDREPPAADGEAADVMPSDDASPSGQGSRQIPDNRRTSPTLNPEEREADAMPDIPLPLDRRDKRDGEKGKPATEKGDWMETTGLPYLLTSPNATESRVVGVVDEWRKDHDPETIRAAIIQAQVSAANNPLAMVNRILANGRAGGGEENRKIVGKAQRQPDAPPVTNDGPDPDGWAEFWNAYPKRDGYAQAKAAYANALAKTTPQDLIDGAKRYARLSSDTEERFLKGPARWLSEQGWMDGKRIGDDGPSEADDLERVKAVNELQRLYSETQAKCGPADAKAKYEEHRAYCVERGFVVPKNAAQSAQDGAGAAN